LLFIDSVTLLFISCVALLLALWLIEALASVALTPDQLAVLAWGRVWGGKRIGDAHCGANEQGGDKRHLELHLG